MADPDAPEQASTTDLVQPLAVLSKAADESPDLDVKLTALLYAIDCHRALGDKDEEARANERFFALLQARKDEQFAWRHVNAYAQHRLFRGLRVVSFINAFGGREEKLFDTELVRQAAQAYEKLAQWFADSDLAPKALDKAAWVYYSCLNDFPTAIPLCARIAKQWPQTEYHLHAEWRLGMMYYTMENWRFYRDLKPAARPEDLVAAKRHFALLVAHWPESKEAPYARHALERMAEDLDRVVIPVGPAER